LIYDLMGFTFCFFLWSFYANRLTDLLFADILDACKVIWWPFQNAKREALHLQVHILHTTPLFGRCVGWLKCYTFCGCTQILDHS
jgi:hypothetical protein